MSLLEEVLRQLGAEFSKSGREDLFQQLRPFVQGDHEVATYAEAARALGTTEGTVKVTVHRMRRRFREDWRSLPACGGCSYAYEGGDCRRETHRGSGVLSEVSRWNA